MADRNPMSDDREPVFAYARLNARLMPMDRGERFEDPLQAVLEESGLGAVSGGGTMQSKDGEIDYCGIDVDLFDLEKGVPFVCEFLTRHGAPKGSVLEFEQDGTQQERPFGRLEGMAVYLNGADLPKSVYEECDVNVICDMFQKLLGDHGSRWSHWQGPREITLYYYGDSFDVMRERVAAFMADYPLCRKARVVRIA